MQNLRPHPERLQRELPEAQLHVDFSMELLQEQLNRRDHGLHEHPDTATSWELASVKKFLERDEVLLVQSHLCRFGLKLRERLSKKSTLFATSSDHVAARLQKLCQCTTEHQQLMSGLPHEAEVYPPALVAAILDGLMAEWADAQRGRPQHLPGRADLEQWAENLSKREPFAWHRFYDSAILALLRPSTLPVRGPGHRRLRWTWVRNVWGNKWMMLEQAATGKPPEFEVNYEHVIVLYHHQELLNSTYVNTNGVTTSEKNMVLRAHIRDTHMSKSLYGCSRLLAPDLTSSSMSSRSSHAKGA